MPDYRPDDLAVVIPTRDRWPILARTLESLRRQTVAGFEVVVVVDGEDQEAPELDGASVVVVTRRGPGGARNAGVRATDRRLLLFLGDDMLPDPVLVERHLEAHRRHPEPEVAVLGLVEWHDEVDGPLNRWLEWAQLQFDFRSFRDAADSDVGFGRFFSCNVSLERQLFLAAGGFDEAFPFYYEDLDCGYRLGRCGMRLIYEPAAVARHLHAYDWDAVVRRFSGIAAGERLMAGKHAWFRPHYLALVQAASDRNPPLPFWPLVVDRIPEQWRPLRRIAEREAGAWYLRRLAPSYLAAWERAGTERAESGPAVTPAGSDESLLAMARRLRHSRRLAPVRQHVAALFVVLGVRSALGGRPRRALKLLGIGAAGFVRRYLKSRREGRLDTTEHLTRMRRLDREVLRRFYITCIGSMEAELEEYPLYDQRKHELRYRLVSDLATAHAPERGTVVDVGCPSGIVLDRVHAARNTRGIGFDLAPYGLRQRHARPDPPLLAQAMVERIPLGDEIADVTVFGEVIEHLVDAYAGMREVSRITRTGGTVILTTNNASEMPVISPVRDPLTWGERLAGRWWPRLLAFRNITWHEPINREADPLPDEAPTYAPHFHFSYRELRDLGEDAGLRLIMSGSFEFPAPQSRFAGWLRRLTAARPHLGNAVADALEHAVATLPGINLMGTHHVVVFRKVGPPRPDPRVPWWPASLVVEQR